jgi:hypothetical protein
MSDQSQRRPSRPSDLLEPVHAADQNAKASGSWAEYLVLFLRVMAAISLIKGLYHWAAVGGIGAAADGGFESHTVAWRTATVFFAVLDLVAAVGLWLAAPWGAVVWLTSVVSMAVVGTVLSASVRRQHVHRGRRGDAACRLSVARDRGCARTAGVRTAEAADRTPGSCRSSAPS